MTINSSARIMVSIQILLCMDGVNWYYKLLFSKNIPAHLAPSPKYPDGQGGHSAPTSGAGASIHSASWKHDTSVHPSTSTVQNSPSHAVCIEKTSCMCEAHLFC